MKGRKKLTILSTAELWALIVVPPRLSKRNRQIRKDAKIYCQLLAKAEGSEG